MTKPLALAAILLAGCAAAPHRPQALEQYRSCAQRVESDARLTPDGKRFLLKGCADEYEAAR